MLLTTKQAAEKLGVRVSVVRGLIDRGKLATYNQPRPGASKTCWEIDSKVLREFQTTYQPPPPRKSKKPVTGNGHAPDMLPLDIPTLVQLDSRIKAIEAKLDKLMAAWGITL